jgi:hypothetical protein
VEQVTPGAAVILNLNQTENQKMKIKGHLIPLTEMAANSAAVALHFRLPPTLRRGKQDPRLHPCRPLHRALGQDQEMRLL